MSSRARAATSSTRPGTARPVRWCRPGSTRCSGCTREEAGYREAMTRLLGLLIVAALALGPSSAAVATSAAPPAASDRAHARTAPTRTQWLADVKAAMHGSRGYVKARVAAASPGETLAINFDIDNTVIATYYD